MPQAVGTSQMIKLPVDREVKARAKQRAIYFFLIYAVASFWAGTETLAILFNFSHALSSQVIVGPIYNPFALVWPWGEYIFRTWPASISAKVEINLSVSWAVTIIGLIFSVIFAKKAYKNHIENAPRAHDYDGSAHWATPIEVGKIGLDKGDTVLEPEHWAVQKATKIYTKQMKSRNVKAKVLTTTEWKEKPGIYLGEYVDPKTNKRY